MTKKKSTPNVHQNQIQAEYFHWLQGCCIHKYAQYDQTFWFYKCWDALITMYCEWLQNWGSSVIFIKKVYRASQFNLYGSFWLNRYSTSETASLLTTPDMAPCNIWSPSFRRPSKAKNLMMFNGAAVYNSYKWTWEVLPSLAGWWREFNSIYIYSPYINFHLFSSNTSFDHTSYAD
jgi:hypothetical protein